MRVSPAVRAAATRHAQILAVGSMLCLALLPPSPTPSLAATPPLVAARTIQGFDTALASVRQLMGAPVAWPRKLPDSRPLFAYAAGPGGGSRRATISFDRTADCHGAHYCSVGAVSVSTDPIEALRNRNGELITRRLADGASFTPEHVMADNFPAELRWTRADLTYTVSWSGLPPGKAAAVLAAVKRSTSARAH